MAQLDPNPPIRLEIAHPGSDVTSIYDMGAILEEAAHLARQNNVHDRYWTRIRIVGDRVQLSIKTIAIQCREYSTAL